MFPFWTWVVGFWLGATIGSFLNVVIYRLPRGLSLAEPKNSFCPTCKHALSAQDLVPLLSWLSTRGKCRYCKSTISARYFWVEVITGAIWAGIWWKFFVVSGPNADWVRGCFYMAASATLVSIIFIDWELYIIPDQINAFLLFLAAVFHAYKGTWADFFWGWFAGWGILFGIALLGRLILQKDSMGHADIKMMRGIGALIGVQMLLANMVVAVFSGLIIGIVGVVVTLIQKSRNPDKAEDPYQPPPPESVKDLIVLGGTYLIALDIPAIWFPQIYEKLGYQMQPENIEEDDWQPSLMTIPFGPYLALGAIICMLFSDGIINVWQNYWRKMTEPSQISIIVSEASFPTGNGRDMSFRWDVRSSSGLSSLVSPDYRNPERDARVERVGRRIGKQI